MTLSKSPKQYLHEKRTGIFAPGVRFLKAAEAAEAFTQVIDEILISLLAPRLAGQQEKFCLVALGGYGRREMCPYSDIDILIIYKPGFDQSLLKKAVALCWDIGLPPGIVVRTLSECRALLGDDVVTDTAYLENRYLYGSRRLFKQLKNEIIRPWFQKQRQRFTSTMYEAVRSGVFTEKGSLYKVEPNLKEGICGLRDCQRIFWSLAVRNHQSLVDKESLLDDFPEGERENFLQGYQFLLGLRHELHMLAGRRLDILEVGWQAKVAGIPGVQPATPTELMQRYFRMVTYIRNFALLFLEYTLHRESWWTTLRRSLGAIEPGEHLHLSDGILFLSAGFKSAQLADPLWYLDVCYLAASCQAALSMQLRNIIRQQLAGLPASAFVSPQIMQKFGQLLALENPVGEILSEMHATGLLEKLIPEFTHLILRVEYDTYHEYPVDEHTLLMLKKLDCIQQDDPLVRDVYRALPDKSLLRLAFLLHDIGKGFPGEHAQTGSILCENICDRLGLEDEQKELIRFLVAHHLLFSATAMRFEIEENLLTQLAGQIGNQTNLSYLFLLTVFDIRCVSGNALTSWKLKLLKDLYLETYHLFEQKIFVLPPENFSELLARYRDGEIHFEHEQFEGFERLTVVGRDKPGFLAELIACLTSEGYNILNTKIRTFADESVVDTLHIQPDNSTTTSAKTRLINIHRKWQQLQAGIVTAAELIARRYRQYPSPAVRHPEELEEIDVSLDNERSRKYTIVQIIMPDEFGLLYKIAACLTDLKMNIIQARLTTKINQVVDTFYVLDAENKKLPTETAVLARQIKEQLRAGALLKTGRSR